MKAAPTASAATAAKQPAAFFNRESGRDFYSSPVKERPFFSKSGSARRSIQTKLRIGRANDVYEKEADSVADKVVQRLSRNEAPMANQAAAAPQRTGAGPLSITPFVQTRCASCEKEDKLQQKEDTNPGEPVSGHILKKPIFESRAESQAEAPAIQPKCAACEKEEKLQQKEEPGSEEGLHVQAKPIFDSNAEPPDDEKNLQRKCASCEKEEKLQKKSGDTAGSASPGIESSLQSSRGSGSPLSRDTREQMEHSFGTDFSNVRIHEDSTAAKMNNELNAQAFTHGNDIYFNSGKYDTASPAGNHLLAHELTHTIQQGQGIHQKKQDKPAPPPATPGYYEGPEGKIDLRDNIKKFFVSKITVPAVKHIFTTDYANLPHKPDERDNTQLDLWKKTALLQSKNIAGKIEAKVKTEDGCTNITDNANNRIYFFKLKASSKDFVIGTLNEVINSVIVPSWNMKGEWADKHVDHKLEIQLGGENNLQNLWLLEASANMSSGALINNEVNRKINALVKAGNEKAALWKGKEVPSATEIRKNHFITVQEYKKGSKVSGNEDDRFLMEDITGKVKPLDGLKALSKKEIEKSKLQGTKSLLRIFFRRSEEQARGWFFDVPNWKANEKVRTKAPFPTTIRNMYFSELTYSPQNNPDEPVGKLKGIAFRYKDGERLVSKKPVELNLLESPAIDFGGYVPMSAFREAVKDIDFIPASPVRIDEITFDNKQGLVVKGKLLPTIPFMEKADIDIIIDGDGVRLRKIFTAGEIKLPGPFEVSNTSLEIQVGSRGLSANGMINFAINNVGEGCLSASVDQKGNIKLNGIFNIASDLFDKSSICFTYERTPEGESKYTIGGHISLGEGKVKGLKKASADVVFGNDQLSAKAMAEPDIKGVGPIEMSLLIEKDKYTFGGKVPLAGLVPRVKEGALEITVTKTPAGLQIAGAGTVVPDIPGVENDPRITVSYDNGAILIKGDLPFKLEKAKAEGIISVGITNQVVDGNNQPTGEIAEGWTVFGTGKVSVLLSKGIAAEAEVTLQPNGEIIISGKVALDRDKQSAGKQDKPFNHTLFKVKPPPIILFAIPPIGASLTLEIIGGARLYASFTPPQIQELSLSLIGFNLTNPNDNFEILGKIKVGMAGKGGIELYLTLKATLSVLVAKVSGELTGSVGLEANADAAASLAVKWSKANGLTIEEGSLSINASAQFLAKLTGRIRVYLDLWLAEIDIWEEELEIASVRFGDAMNVGFKLPVAMKDGELKAGELNKDAFVFPDLSSESEQQKVVKQAASEDEKVKPPPPPSKEEAIAAVNKLDAGEVEFWDVLFMDADKARTYVKLGWVTRDTYVLWLKTKHARLDWSEVAASSLRKDEIDYEEARNRISNTKGSPYDRLLKVLSFKEDHRLFTDAHSEKLDALLQLVKNPRKQEAPVQGPVQQPVPGNPPAVQGSPATTIQRTEIPGADENNARVFHTNPVASQKNAFPQSVTANEKEMTGAAHYFSPTNPAPVHQTAGTPGIQREPGDKHDLTAAGLSGDPLLERVFDNEAIIEKFSRQKGDHVKKIQEALIQLGIELREFGADAHYGTETENAVREFQAKASMSVPEQDGVVGRKTLGLLDRSLRNGRISSDTDDASDDFKVEDEKKDEACKGKPTDDVCPNPNTGVENAAGTAIEMIDKVLDEQLPPVKDKKADYPQIFDRIFRNNDTRDLSFKVAEVRAIFEKTRDFIRDLKKDKKLTRCATDCDGGCRSGSPAYHTPTKSGSHIITFCPGFEKDKERFLIVIHESHHAAIPGSSDKAYAETRLFDKLDHNKALLNAASFHVYAAWVDQPGSQPIGPDIKDTNLISDPAQKGNVDMSLAFLQQWFRLVPFDVSQTVQGTQEAREKGRYTQNNPRVFMELVFSKWFGLTTPPAVPTAEDVKKLRAIDERVKKMDQAFKVPFVILETPDESFWTRGPGADIALNPEVLKLDAQHMIIALLQELVHATPEISADIEALYVGTINDMRNLRNLDP